MKTKPRALILSGYGLNCEEETAFAFERAGAETSIKHLSDLIEQPDILKRFQILAVPGGFSFGDHTGSGRAYGNKLKANLKEALQTFASRDTLTIGICNGFQILVEFGILPGALLHNTTPRYQTRWVDLEVSGNSPWLSGMRSFSVPIAHGEGNYHADKKTLDELAQGKAIAVSYVEGEMTKHFSLPANPNGSTRDIAGVTSHGGRVIGMMPHPERAIVFTQLPHWSYLAETYRRRGEPLPKAGPGLKLFQNAAKYFS